MNTQKDENENEPEILYNKEGTKIIKVSDGYFHINFSIQNKNIILASVLNFDMLKLIYDLNPDICEKVELQKISEEECLFTILVKNFFEDLGIAQKFSCLKVQKIVDKSIHFRFHTCNGYQPEWLPEDIELAIIDEIHVVCSPKSPHNIDFSCSIQFPTNNNIPAFVQKMSVMIVHKIINRLKQFIENVKVTI